MLRVSTRSYESTILSGPPVNFGKFARFTTRPRSRNIRALASRENADYLFVVNILFYIRKRCCCTRKGNGKYRIITYTQAAERYSDVGRKSLGKKRIIIEVYRPCMYTNRGGSTVVRRKIEKKKKNAWKISNGRKVFVGVRRRRFI